jgi:hypothetical protein
VIDLLRSLRSLILGETWTIPLGVATTLLVAAVLRAALSDHLWDEIGGFALAGMVAATLVLALASSR